MRCACCGIRSLYITFAPSRNIVNDLQWIKHTKAKGLNPPLTESNTSQRSPLTSEGSGEALSRQPARPRLTSNYHGQRRRRILQPIDAQIPPCVTDASGTHPDISKIDGVECQPRKCRPLRCSFPTSRTLAGSVDALGEKHFPERFRNEFWCASWQIWLSMRVSLRSYDLGKGLVSSRTETTRKATPVFL